MTTPCEQIEQHLPAHLFGELDDPAVAESVRDHLESCPDCRAKLEQFESTMATLTAAAAELPDEKLSDTRRAQIREQTAAESDPPQSDIPPTFKMRWWRPLTIAAAVVLLCISLIGLLLPELSTPRHAADTVAMTEPASEVDADALHDFKSAPAPDDPAAPKADPEPSAESYFFRKNGESADRFGASQSRAGDAPGNMPAKSAGPLGGEKAKNGNRALPRQSNSLAEQMPTPNLSPRAVEESEIAVDQSLALKKQAPAERDMLDAAQPATPGKAPAGGLASGGGGRVGQDKQRTTSLATKADARPNTFGDEKAADAIVQQHAQAPMRKAQQQQEVAEAPAIALHSWTETNQSEALKKAETAGKPIEQKAGQFADEEQAASQRRMAESERRRAPIQGKLNTSLDRIQQQLEEPADQSLPPASSFRAVPVNPFVMTARDKFSTFAIDVDTASYALSRKYIRRGFLPPAGAVRMEEFVNTFDYNYPTQDQRPFAVHVDGADAPFGDNLTLVKIGVKAKTIGRDGRKPAHLVFVVDASGSMDQDDRLPLVQQSLKLLAGQLDANDRVTLIAYNTKANLLLEAAGADQRQQIMQAVDAIQTAGSTNMLDGLSLGYDLAERHFRAGYINHIVLCSDGVANVGATEADQMLQRVAKQRKQGITLTTAGFGLGGYNDAMMEKLANSGDGQYVFVDDAREAKRVFVESLAATLQTVARDAKIQVEFDPARVRRYRLIGYENRDIADADFQNDAIDAGEVGSGQSATALYEVELIGEPAADLGAVAVRYRDVETDRVEQISYALRADAIDREATAKSAPRLHLAAAAAEFAELLRQSEHAAGGSFEAVERVLVDVTDALPMDQQAAELLKLVRRAKGLPRAP